MSTGKFAVAAEAFVGCCYVSQRRDKPWQRVVANALKLYRNEAVGFIDWLDLGFVANHFDVVPGRTNDVVSLLWWISWFTSPSRCCRASSSYRERVLSAVEADFTSLPSDILQCGLPIAERTYFDWCEKHLHFSQVTTCAIGKSKIGLVDKLRLSDDWRAAAFLLERRWPDEFGRCDIRPLPPPEEKKKINVAFIVNTGGKSLEEVANFPVF